MSAFPLERFTGNSQIEMVAFPLMRTHSVPRLAVAAFVVSAAAVTASTVGAGAAGAAAVTTTTAKAPSTAPSVFCAQLRTSQTAMSQVGATTKDRYAKVAAEWSKIERFAPAGIKADVTAIRTAYEKASKQTGTAVTTTLTAAAAPGQRVTAFATKNCPAGNRAGGTGPGGGGAQFQAFQDCLAKEGVTNIGRRVGPGQGGGNGRASQSPPTTDAKTAAALQKCQSLRPEGARIGGPGGIGGRAGGPGGSPELQACLQSKGVTLPAFGGAGQNGGQTRVTIDQKTRDAIEACRQQIGSTGSANRTATTTTLKK
jgi:hypothetical protein